MTTVYLTVDTEYSSGMAHGPDAADRRDNFTRSIAGPTRDGGAGIPYQLATLARHGQRAVFFVDPMPALVWGVAAIEDVVGPIVAAGQDVQLHCHTEWLALAGAANPLRTRTGTHIKDFPLEEQCRLLAYARDTLVAAGAPAPVAFRAGNYGANDDTLRALAEIGLRYDSSHCPALPDGACAIGLTPQDRAPVERLGVVEVPVGCIGAGRGAGGLRHAQITALSRGEMNAAIRHARAIGQPGFTLVSHSFELLNRHTLAANRIVRRRFARLCRDLAAMEGVRTGTYRDDPPRVEPGARYDPLPHGALRTGRRLAEQALSNALYGA